VTASVIDYITYVDWDKVPQADGVSTEAVMVNSTYNFLPDDYRAPGIISYGTGTMQSGAAYGLDLSDVIPAKAELKLIGGLFLAGLKGIMIKEGTTIIGEGMARVEAAASKIPGSKILNGMPKFTGTADQVTSQMMQYNRKWILNEMRSGRAILDIGRDAARTNPSVFYQMEQNMLRNYLKLHPGSLNIIKP
jgi:hypothetical protein